MSTIVIQPVDYSVRPLPGQFSFGNRMPGEINVFALRPITDAALDINDKERVEFAHGKDSQHPPRDLRS